MIPLRDNIPSRRTPFVNYLLLAANVLVFIWELSMGPSLQPAIETFAAVPAEFFETSGVDRWAPLFTSMFMHGGFWHLGSNMIALYIFGDNVEDAMGHGRYLFFYLLAGVIASLTHIFLAAESTIPIVGASGAIAGVLAAYFVMFPQASVDTLVFLFYIITTIRIPAIVYLGFWFLSQVFNGVFALTTATVQTGGGVAWWAHIGGFVAGLILVFVFRRKERIQQRYQGLNRY